MSYFTVQINQEISLINWFKQMHVAKNRINYLIDNQFCYANDKILNRNSIIKKGDCLIIDLSNYDSDYDQNKAINSMKLEVQYEDEYIIVVDKKTDMIVYSDDSSQITMTDIVREYLKKRGESTLVYPAHRLDRETTGCLIYCKDIITLAYFSYLFEHHEVNKEYLAIVEGKTNLKEIITLSIGSDRHINNKMVVTKNGKPAYTRFETLKYIKNYSLIKVSIKTGRTHQIRVHLSAINHPLVGDKLYGSKISLKRFFLHCEEISFYYPFKEKKMRIKIGMPKDMVAFAN